MYHRDRFTGFLIIACRSPNQPPPAHGTKARLLADKEDHPSKIVTDGEAAYYVTGGRCESAASTNNIKKISLTDGSVSSGQRRRGHSDTTPRDRRQVCLLVGRRQILRWPKTGGTSEKIIPKAPKPDEIVWTKRISIGGLGRRRFAARTLDGRAEERRLKRSLDAEVSGNERNRIDENFVYWISGDGIKEIRKDWW
jgi:hypothetical protein